MPITHVVGDARIIQHKRAEALILYLDKKDAFPDCERTDADKRHGCTPRVSSMSINLLDLGDLGKTIFSIGTTGGLTGSSETPPAER